MTLTTPLMARTAQRRRDICSRLFGGLGGRFGSCLPGAEHARAPERAVHEEAAGEDDF